jgi:hypothetical protein
MEIFLKYPTHSTKKTCMQMERERYGTATEGINVPLRISSINSSPPTTSAPAALASSAAGPSANTATLTVLKISKKKTQYEIHIIN